MKAINDKRLVCIQNIQTNEKKRIPRNEIPSKYSLTKWKYISKSVYKNNTE